MDAREQICWGRLTAGFELSSCRGLSVLLAADSQLAAVTALLAQEGTPPPILLHPPPLPEEHLPQLAPAAEADVLVSDRAVPALAGLPWVPVPSSGELPQTQPGAAMPASHVTAAEYETQWILLTSGTTGVPKLVVHTLGSLTAAIKPYKAPDRAMVWSTFYDIRRFGGLQILLRAALAGSSLLLSDPRETPAEFLARAGAHGVTHISGTPSHWRRALMSASAGQIAPASVRLSGEIADQPLLHQLRAQYPAARLVHAFATTEAGVLFEVEDGCAGIPAGALADAASPASPVQAKLTSGTLRVRSPRAASGYLGLGAPPLRDADGFVDTHDTLELRGDRFHFTGRSDGTINVGGAKVHPEEVEAVLNSHPEISGSLVKARKSPVTGALVAADVVLKTGPGSPAVARQILAFCRETLPAHKVPAALVFVSALPVTAAGKLVRRHA